MKPHQALLLTLIIAAGILSWSYPLTGGVAALAITGYLCLDETRFTRGPGSWRTDNILRVLAGVCFGAAFSLVVSQLVEALK